MQHELGSSINTTDLRRNATVMRREVIAGIAEGARPDLSGEVCSDVGVQDSTTLFARHRCILYHLHKLQSPLLLFQGYGQEPTSHFSMQCIQPGIQ